jgi:NAD+ diphosphatase
MVDSEPRLYFAFRGRDLLVRDGREGADASVPDGDEWMRLGLYAVRENALGEVAGAACVAVELADDAEAPAGYELRGLRSLYARLHEPVFRMAGRAVQVMEWDRSHQFCARCGSPTERMAGEMAKVCPRCGRTDYPRLNPAVIMRIDHGERVLLARGPNTPPGMYSTLAGFVEPGESLEEAVAREVAEEVGIRIRNVTYFGSQPWPFPNSLMIGFTTEYAGGDIVPQPGEIEDARWWTVDELPNLPGPLSISRALIDAWIVAQGRDPASVATALDPR